MNHILYLIKISFFLFLPNLFITIQSYEFNRFVDFNCFIANFIFISNFVCNNSLEIHSVGGY
jgi:hypothetical protein